jgi:hypothetical protein
MVSFVSLIIGFVILFAFLVVVLGYLIFNQQRKARDISNVLKKFNEDSIYNLSGVLDSGEKITLYFMNDLWGWYEFSGGESGVDQFQQLGQFILSQKQNESKIDMMRPTYFASANPGGGLSERKVPTSTDKMYLVFNMNGTPSVNSPNQTSYQSTLLENRDDTLAGKDISKGDQINFVKNK